MDPQAVLRPSLDAGRLAVARHHGTGWRVEVLEEAGSTNAVVSERASTGEAEGLVVVAEHQRSGRGRLDRLWQTPARSGLTFSVLLRPSVAARSWPWLPLLTGLAVGETLRAAGFDAVVKWPNDVLVGERKLCGILVERVETPAGPAAVVGIGLNVTMSADELPVQTATSLALEGDAPDRTDLLLALLSTLASAYSSWQEGGPAAGERLRATYAAACTTVGRRVRVELPTGPLEGTATGIDADGRLLVDAGGSVHPLSAGDVVHVRSAPE